MAIDAGKAEISDQFWTRLEALESLILKSKAQDLTANGPRDGVRGLIKFYFADVRPIWVECRIDEDNFHITDAYCQELLQLANGKNRRLSYLKKLRAIKSRRPSVDTELARYVPVSPEALSEVVLSQVELQIFDTLSSLILTAALSYKQVLVDLRASRLSYRGTAVELREALREILDHLAPDSEVMGQAGFRLEGEQKRPTMRQKAHFVLKARGLPGNAMNAAKDSIQVTENLNAQLARSVYEKGSVATHIATTRDEVVRVKQYTDAVLIELLQISLN